MTEIFDKKIAEFEAKPKTLKYHIIVTAEEKYQEEEKLKTIYNDFKNDPLRIVQEIINIADNYQIAKVKHNRKEGPSEILYYVYVNFKRLNICTYSLDTAIIEAIAHKYNCGQAAIWIERMLGIKVEPEYEE